MLAAKNRSIAMPATNEATTTTTAIGSTRERYQPQRDGASDQASRVVPRSSSRPTIGTPRNRPITEVTIRVGVPSSVPSDCCAPQYLSSATRQAAVGSFISGKHAGPGFRLSM